MKTNDGSPFPKRLKEARLRKGLSQKQLGILAGVDPSSASPRMNQYEKGVHTPDFQMARALAKVLEVPTAFLFCEEDSLAEIILSKRGNFSK
ncbi:MAG: transcriptional regulator with XRE-family HTH domain [Pseudoalteromonas distincta]|jgi:transcriptional regulator with XRE-family HTH domain|uniref:helix-turn-helix domain-containing protein n=1 Tax=Pseudoalteromonas distincta TaxID=77608 RepID=UPI0039E4E994